MPPTTLQVASIILPQVWTTGAEVETVNDLLTHPSVDIPTDYLEEKSVHITAIEVVVAGAPGNLWCWIEVGPVDFNATGVDTYYTAIGGGGGPLDPGTGLPYIAPMAPVVLVPVGVNLTVHTLILPWVVHSPFSRLVIQTPVAATPLTAFWTVQAMVSGKSP